MQKNIKVEFSFLGGDENDKEIYVISVEEEKVFLIKKIFESYKAFAEKLNGLSDDKIMCFAQVKEVVAECISNYVMRNVIGIINNVYPEADAELIHSYPSEEEYYDDCCNDAEIDSTISLVW